jgi:hypothetical protein
MFCLGNSILYDFLGPTNWSRNPINPLNAKLNPICYLLALLGAHYFLHVSRIRVKSFTLRLQISYIYIYIYIYKCVYIYIEHQFLTFLDHTQRRNTFGRTPLDEWSARRKDNTRHSQQKNIHAPVGFEPTISAGERPLSVSVVCCQVEVSATSWSLVQRSHTDYGALSCVI